VSAIHTESNATIPIAVPVRATALLGNHPQAARRPNVDFTGRRIHFMGAGGIGVSALMELCASRGALVSGCDCSDKGQVPALRARGIAIDASHCASHAETCDELVYSAAVPKTHPEVQHALKLERETTTRMRMLGKIADGTRAVCVTGAHGKTTTTWLIARTLIAARRNPSVLVGGVVKELGGNVRTGQGEEFVAEVDESDNRLSEVVPSIPVLTNIDNDHLDNYGSIDNIESALCRFLSSTDVSDPRAVLVGCGDDPRVRRVLLQARTATRLPAITYGFKGNCDLRAINLRSSTGTQEDCAGWVFDVLGPFGLWVDVNLPMPGEHNILNALAAISVAWHLGISQDCVRSALSGIERVGRRFEIKGTVRGVRVVDDYGHHPTEIRATIAAARQNARGRVGMIFQPHRYTRTASLMQDFASCFAAADALFLMPIYAASEAPIPGVDHGSLARAITLYGKPVQVCIAADRNEAVNMAAAWAKSGDTILTQGAGDVTRAGDELVSRL